jgi:hypothetical protein
MRILPALVMFFFGFVGVTVSEDKKTADGKPEPAPVPRVVPESVEGPGGWRLDPKSDEWTDLEGTRWKFDGLRWRVLWIDNQWYPVIPPGPLPGHWRQEDLGQGWSEVLPPNSSGWHIIPPSAFHMPPPFVFPPPVAMPGAGPARPQRLFTRRWR